MTEFYLLKNNSNGQMMGLLFRDDENIIIFDGGTGGDSVGILSLLEDLGVSHIDAWFFTHPHPDHTFAFRDILLNHKEISVGKVLRNFPSPEFIKEHTKRGEYEYNALVEFNKLSDKRFTSFNKGDVFYIGKFKIEVMRTFNPEITSDVANNSSAVFKVTGENKTVLILGDLGIEAGHEVMEMYMPESLEADFTQMAHHGQNGVDKSFYEKFTPKACLWASPSWLWDNDQGNGFDTGIYNTVRTREWMAELGVTEHYVEKDGPIRLEI